MKNSRIIWVAISTFLTILTTTSCNDWLDELPDKRAELDEPDKIAQLLVTAYPTEMPVLMFEIMSDNYTDNGPMYQMAFLDKSIEQFYFFRETNEVAWDCPQTVWQNSYGMISTANQALLAIKELNMPEETRGSEGEALLCRAYAHYNLVTTFCRAYNHDTSDSDPGIPYLEEPQTSVNPKHERGTVSEVYAKIARDIEDGLPLVQNKYTTPKFHFTRKAANAFAARFFLFYGEYEKAVKYATAAIGEDPTIDMRDLYEYNVLSQPSEQSYKYHNPEEKNNIMVQPIRSLWGRIYNLDGEYMRYGHPISYTQIVYRQRFPWGGTCNYGSSGFSLLWQRGSSGKNGWAAKCNEIFEYTNPTTGSGQPHIVLVPFTVEETLMVRAEAYAMLENYDACAKDLSIWYSRNGGYEQDATSIADWYKYDLEDSPRYRMESKFIQSEMQENMVRAVLAVRRVEGMSLGMRWLDIKRHGIEVRHEYYKTSTETDFEVLKPYDLRTAIQLPADVIYAGLEANPR